MSRLHSTAAALIILAVAVSGCSRNRDIPTELAPARLTTIGVNTYLWRAAIDTVSFAPLLQADANTGVIITDWYTNPQSPGEMLGGGSTTVGFDPVLDAKRFRRSEGGVCLITQAMIDRLGQ